MIEPAALLTPDMRRGLESGNDGTLSRTVARTIGPALIRDMAEGRVDEGEALSWLTTPAILPWLRGAQESDLLGGFPMREPPPRALGALAAPIAGTLERTPQAWGTWVAQLLAPCLRRTDLAGLRRAEEALLSILARSAHENELLLASEVAEAVRRTRHPEGQRLIVVAFPSFYLELRRGQSFPFYRASWWGDREWGWDKAKGWRHWLLDTWLERRWPMEALLQILASDEDLAWRVFKRASKGSQKKMLMEARGILERSWRGPEPVRVRMLGYLDKLG